VLYDISSLPYLLIIKEKVENVNNIYMTRKTVLFVPPKSTILDHPVVKNLGSKYPFLNIPNFDTFFNERVMTAYPNFCGYLTYDIVADALERHYLTIISMNDDDIFSILVCEPGDDYMYIHMFCGNKSLPSTGSGTKLLKILEKACLEEDVFKMELDSVRPSIQYYKNYGFHLLSNVTNREISNRATVDMEKNLRADSHWSKIRSSLSQNDVQKLSVIYSRMKTSRANGIKCKKNKGKRSRKIRKSKFKNSKKVRT
jgi:hypothetical protein